MNKFGLRLLHFTGFFVIFFILLNTIYLTVIISTDWDFKKRIETLRFDNPEFDVLVLGASLAMDGIDTELLNLYGIKAYSLTLGGSGIKTNYLQLKEYLTLYSTKPKTVIFGSNSYLDKFTDEKINPIYDVTTHDHKYSLKDIPILRFKWLGFEFMKKVVSRNHRKAKLSYGQLKFQKAISDKTNYKDSWLNIKQFESSFWLKEIAKLCGHNDIEFIILDLPGYKETRNLSDVGPYKLSFDEFTATLFNFNSRYFCEIFDDNKDWVGNSHLNEIGAIKFTEKLIPLLK